MPSADEQVAGTKMDTSMVAASFDHIVRTLQHRTCVRHAQSLDSSSTAAPGPQRCQGSVRKVVCQDYEAEAGARPQNSLFSTRWQRSIARPLSIHFSLASSLMEPCQSWPGNEAFEVKYPILLNTHHRTALLERSGNKILRRMNALQIHRIVTSISPKTEDINSS